MKQTTAHTALLSEKSAELKQTAALAAFLRYKSAG